MCLLLWWALSLWFTEYRVTVDEGLLTITRRGLIARAPIEIPRAWVHGIRVRRGMQAGNKLYYDLRVETGEGTHTAASSIADYAVATWLASHWMTGGRGLAQDVARGIGDAGVFKAVAAQSTRIAAPARASFGVRLIARHGQREIHAERNTAPHDVGLRHFHERCIDDDGAALDALLRREPREILKRVDELGTAIRVARIVDVIHADHDARGIEHFGPRERKARGTPCCAPART